MKRSTLYLLLLLTVGCGDTIIEVPAAPSTVNNSSLRVEYRVTGNATSARIRFFNTNDGLTQTVTTLPFSTSFSTTQDNLFLSLEVTPVSYSGLIEYPFLSAQIFVGGVLFREATSSEFLLNTISVSGTWRR